MIPGPDMVVACPHCEDLARLSTLVSGNTLAATWWTDGFCSAPMKAEPIDLARCKHCSHLFWIEDATVVGEIPNRCMQMERYSLKVIDVGHRRLDAMTLLRTAKDCTAQEARRVIDNPPFEVTNDDCVADHWIDLEDRLREIGATVSRQIIDDNRAPIPRKWEQAPLLEIPTAPDAREALGAGLAMTTKRESWTRTRLWWFHNAPLRSKNPTPIVNESSFRENLKSLRSLLTPDNGDVERLQLAEVHRELGDFDEASALLEHDLADGLRLASAFLRRLVDSRVSELREFPSKHEARHVPT